MTRSQVHAVRRRVRRLLLVSSALGALIVVALALALAVAGFAPAVAAHAVPTAQVQGSDAPGDAESGSGGDGNVEGDDGDRGGEDGTWEGTGVEGGGATGPSPTGQARPDSSQRTLDTIIWAGLLVSLAVAGVVVFRVWRDVGVDPPLVDLDAQRGTGRSERSRRKSG